MIPKTDTGTYHDVFSIVATLCYGHDNCVDMLELCGGDGGMSEMAFARGQTSGGSHDKRTKVDIGDP